MARFSQYTPATSPTDYTDATNFLIEDPNGDIKLASLEGLKTFFCSTYCSSVTIPSADVLTLDSTPYEIVAAPGAGFTIEVISCSVKLAFNSAAYTGGVILRLGTTTGQPVMQNTVLDATQTTIRPLATTAATTVGYVIMAENAALTIDVPSPVATGDSDIEVFVHYRLLSV
jgi:hypothetical protein